MEFCMHIDTERMYSRTRECQMPFVIGQDFAEAHIQTCLSPEVCEVVCHRTVREKFLQLLNCLEYSAYTLTLTRSRS